MLVVIRDKPFTKEDYTELLTKVVLASAIRDRALLRQGIRIQPPETFNEDTITAAGLEVAAYLAKRFSEDLHVTPKNWQQRVRMYERNNAWQLQQLMQDISADIQTLKHTEALQEVNRALAYLQRWFPLPQEARVQHNGKPIKVGTNMQGQCPDGYVSDGHSSCILKEVLRQGELSGMANPDLTVRVFQPDDNGQCPAGTMWSARVGGCVPIEDGTAQLGFDTSKGGNLASSDLRRARALTGRQQFRPEGVDVRLDQGDSNRWHPDNDYTANRAMGNPKGDEFSDRNIDTQRMPGGDRLPRVLSGDMLNRQESLREGELSGMTNPDKEVEVIPADANGQCKAGWMYSARVGGCVRIDDGTAQTGFDTFPGGNTAASDLRKPRFLTDRRQFTPEGTKIALDQGGIVQKSHTTKAWGETDDRMSDARPNRAMGNAGIEQSDTRVDTEQMPGGQRVNNVNVQARSRPTEAYSGTREGELSGMANPDQVLHGVPPDSKGQCERGFMFSAMVGLCIPFSPHQQNKFAITPHIPEGTVTRLGRTYGHDNSDQPNPAMGFMGPLASLEDERWLRLSEDYLVCMRMLKDNRFSFYASKHATERFCFYLLEGKFDGYIGHGDQLRHMTVFHWTDEDEQALKDWQKAEKEDFEAKTKMDTDYDEQTRIRLHYRPALTDLIQRGRTDETIQRILEKNTGLTSAAIRSLMTDVRILRNIPSTYARPKQPSVTIKFNGDSSDS
jgi:hypothetical protein